MNDDVTLIVIVGVIALAIVIWFLYLASALVVAFTAFVLQLPLLISIIMFIIFPPTLIVFLAGLAFIQFGLAERIYGDGSQGSGISESERKRRRALGYDE